MPQLVRVVVEVELPDDDKDPAGHAVDALQAVAGMANTYGVQVGGIAAEPPLDDYNHPLNEARRAYEWDFRSEIEKYLPAIKFMSFAGPRAIVAWVFDRVQPKPEATPKEEKNPS